MTEQRICTPDLLLQVAQDFVDDWRADPNRPPFAQALADNDPERCPWPCLKMSESQKKAFPVVSKAIRVGQGHATANPEPLLELLRSFEVPAHTGS
jgi:hypothetical protein